MAVLPVRVIVYGEHSHDWMSALGPGSAAWDLVARVSEVLAIPARPSALEAVTAAPGTHDVVLPLMEEHIRALPEGMCALVPGADALRICSDKRLFAEHLTAHGRGSLVPAVFDVDDEVGFPIVLKRLDLNAGFGVRLIFSPEQLSASLQEEPWAGHAAMLQEYESHGPDYVTHMVCCAGVIDWHRTYVFEHEGDDAFHVRGAGRALRPVALEDGLMLAFRDVVALLGLSGPANVNFKVHDGRARIFEINPRFGGSLLRPANVADLAEALARVVDLATTRR